MMDGFKSSLFGKLRNAPPWLKQPFVPLKPMIKSLLRRNGAAGVPAAGQANDIWGDRHLDPVYWGGAIHWGSVPEVDAYMNRMISGDPAKGWIAYTREKYIDPLRIRYPKLRMLSLCCGVGRLEMDLVASGFVDAVDGYEYSIRCVEDANREAAARGLSDRVRFFQADLNAFKPPTQDQYPVILNEAALHHIKNLEGLIGGLQPMLAPGGVIVNHDYVGPNQHQWTAQQLGMINALLALLPKEARCSRTNQGLIHERRQALSLAEMNQIDPTEGIRASEIIPMMSQYFDIAERRDFGGTILHLLLNDIAGNLNNDRHRPFVAAVIDLEERLIKGGYLSSDFAWWVAQAKAP